MKPITHQEMQERRRVRDYTRLADTLLYNGWTVGRRVLDENRNFIRKYGRYFKATPSEINLNWKHQRSINKFFKNKTTK